MSKFDKSVIWSICLIGGVTIFGTIWGILGYSGIELIFTFLLAFIFIGSYFSLYLGRKNQEDNSYFLEDNSFKLKNIKINFSLGISLCVILMVLGLVFLFFSYTLMFGIFYITNSIGLLVFLIPTIKELIKK